MRVEPPPDRNRVAEIYTEDYFKEYLDNTVSRGKYFKGALKKLNGLAAKGKILDVGCGDGLFLRIAKEDGWETAGIEPSRSGAALAETKYGINVFNGFPEDADIDDSPFDAITLFNVLGHMEDQFSAVIFLKKLLKEGGLLLIETPNFNSAWFKYRVLENAVLGIDDLHIPSVSCYFNESSLRSLLDKAGFEIIGFDFVNYSSTGTSFSPQGAPLPKRAYLNYRRILKTACASISALFKNGDHISVICRKGA